MYNNQQGIHKYTKMKLKNKYLKNRTIRFIFIGIINTSINFVILNIAFYFLGFTKVWSNIFATSVALVISFILNKNFVFAHKGAWFKPFLLFLAVSISGTLILNNTIYALSINAFRTYDVSISHQLHSLNIPISPSFVSINGSAAIATIFSMLWNYNWYKKVVFNSKEING